MFTKALYKQVGPFDEQFKIAGDFDWCVRAAKVTDKFVRAKTIAGTFRVDGTGLSSGGNSRLAVEDAIICLRHSIPYKAGEQNTELNSKYQVGSILFKGNYMPFNQPVSM